MLTQDRLNYLTKKLQPICTILDAIALQGGTVFLVGGAVRDLIMEIDIGDIDLEVHGLEIDELQKILKKFGPVSFVGRKFGVFKLHRHNVDLALPRFDSEGRKPVVTLNPHMGIEKALRRRDVTMNAMAINITHLPKLIINDPFGGQQDIEKNVIRAVDTSFFTEDPLRFFRVMHFIGRFEMYPDDQLNQLCTSMSLSPDEIAPERIHEEIRKLFLLSKKPSMGFIWIKQIGRLEELFEEISYLNDNDFEHTMQALNRAAHTNTSKHDRIALCMAAICHKLTPEQTKQLIKRFTNTIKLHKICITLLKQLPIFEALDVESSYNLKHLAWKLSPYSSIQQLALFVTTITPGNHSHTQAVEDAAQQLNVLTHREPALVKGKDLIATVKDGRLLGKLLQKAYRLQIAGNTDKKSLLKSIT